MGKFGRVVRGAEAGALAAAGVALSGFVAVLVTAYRIATFTLLHFLSFALVGVLASFLFDWKHGAGLKSLLVVAVLCTAAFSATVAGSSSVVTLESLGAVLLVAVNLLAAILLVGYLRLAAMPEPEEGPAAGYEPPPEDGPTA